MLISRFLEIFAS